MPSKQILVVNTTYRQAAKFYDLFGSKNEIVELLRKTGFKVKKIYGDFEKSKHQEDNTKLVLVTRKK